MSRAYSERKGWHESESDSDLSPVEFKAGPWKVQPRSTDPEWGGWALFHRDFPCETALGSNGTNNFHDLNTRDIMRDFLNWHEANYTERVATADVYHASKAFYHKAAGMGDGTLMVWETALTEDEAETLLELLRKAVKNG